MPNNSNARRKKDKKKQSKKKKTDPPPLHKEDKASMDSSSHSLSLAGKDKASVDSVSLFSSLAGKDSEKVVDRPQTFAQAGGSKQRGYLSLFFSRRKRQRKSCSLFWSESHDSTRANGILFFSLLQIVRKRANQGQPKG